MKPQFKQIADKLGIQLNITLLEERLEEFAELIVKECAEICRERKLTPSAFTADELLEHFGVE